LAFPDNVDVRLCGLGELIAADLADGETPSEWIRDAVAKKLGVDAPVVELGQRNFGEQGAAGAAARWGKKRKKKPVAKRRAID
jgi:transposase